MSSFILTILYQVRVSSGKALTVGILSQIPSDKCLGLSSLTEIKWSHQREKIYKLVICYPPSFYHNTGSPKMLFPSFYHKFLSNDM